LDLKRNIAKLIPPALIAAVVLACFSPWWIGGLSLAPLDLMNRMMSPWRGTNETTFAKNHFVSDAVDENLVWRLIAERDFRREGQVGWSSMTYGGTAQYANTMALYFDWTMQLHRWFDFWTAWHLGLLGQVLVAAWGMLLFLRGRDISAPWATCGALAYAANSQFVTWIYHRWALGAFCWVPLILWAIDSYRRGRSACWVAVPLLIAMAFLGGTLQHAALVALAVAIMWLEEIVQSRRVPGSWIRITGRHAAWGMLGCGLAAMMLIPCTDAFLTSTRLGLHAGMTANAENSIYPHGPLQPLFNLAAYPFQIFPSLLGRCNSIDLMKLFKSDLFYICYFGSLPLIIAFSALWRRGVPLFARLMIAAGLLLPLTPLVRFLYQRLFLLFMIGGILAFVSWMERSGKRERIRFCQVLAILGTTIATLWTGVSLILLTQQARLATLAGKIAEKGEGSSFGYFTSWRRMRADHFIDDLFIWSPQQFWPLLLFAAALFGVYLTAHNSEFRKRIGMWLVMASVVAEVALFASRWVAWCDPSTLKLYPETAESRALMENVGRHGRVTTVIHPTAHLARTPFVPNTLAAYGIATISGYDSIVPNGMVLPNETPADAARLGRFAVSHLVTWNANPDVPQPWQRVWRGGSMDLYANPLAVPRYAGFVDDAARNSFLKGGMGGWLRIEEQCGLENRRKIVVPAGVRWIRIAENHASGWQYRVPPESRWSDVGQSPEKCMWIANPASSKASVIEMRYHPPLFFAGLWISAVALAITLLAGFVRFFHRPAAADPQIPVQENTCTTAS
jgi:hypothetical protein